MGSTRLPGKVLLDLAGEPMLCRVVQRLSRARTLDAVWIATTIHEHDDVLAMLCAEREWPCFRGKEEDVLDRYYHAAHEAGAEKIVRVTSDCPLIDPDIVDRVVLALGEREGTVYSSNTVPIRTFPGGLDVEAFDVSALETTWREASSPSDREHVTPYIWSQPERFSQAKVTAEDDFSHHRWMVDTEEDYALVRQVYAHFGNGSFGWRDVLELIGKHPDWSEINAHVQ
jgi:spore coat polysaccharide biosynthesis protein SpsF